MLYPAELRALLPETGKARDIRGGASGRKPQAAERSAADWRLSGWLGWMTEVFQRLGRGMRPANAIFCGELYGRNGLDRL